MSGSSLKETDPALQLYEAQAIIIEKDQKLREKDAEIEQLRQENERLRIPNSNRNQQELAQTVEKLGKEQAVSKADIFHLSERFKNLELAVNQSTQNENKVEKQSGGLQNTSILILGGDGPLNRIYLFNSKTQSWKKLRITITVEMHSFGAVALNEEIYIFGGSSENAYLQDCYKLKDDGSWIRLASINQERASISSSSLVYKGDIWVIGGYSGEYLKSVEKYDISQDKWTYMPQMNYPRSDAAAAVFKDRIFVTGGWNGECLKSVEMFDPKLQKWILFCDLAFEVGGHTMLINNSTLSMFGGESRSRSLNSVWEMDIEDPEKKWTEKQSFKYPRRSFGIGKLSNGIIVFGGWGGSETSEIFVGDKWEDIPGLPKIRSNFGCGETSEIFDGNKWIDGPRLPQKLLQFAYTSIPRSLEESFLKKCS